jgi:putative transposase
VLRCVACGHQANADVNAAKNIAAGRKHANGREAVAARGCRASAGPANRETQLDTFCLVA